MAALAIGALAGPALAAGAKTITVSGRDLADGYPTTLSHKDRHWYSEDTRAGGASAIVNTYGAPAGFGDGSLELTTTPTNADKAQRITHQVAGTPLADVSELAYWTYQAAGNTAPTADASYQLQIDLDGDPATTSDFTTLVYEPYWNGTVAPATWQHWDAASGNWWSSRDIPGVVVHGAGGPPFTTPAAVAETYPNATVLGIGVNVGTYNPGYTVATDGVKFATTNQSLTFDFELGKDDCKHGGWQTAFAPLEFQNQGDCVAYVASAGRNQPAN